MLTGLKGVKYGLQQPAKKPGQAPKAKPKPQQRLAAFAQDDDSDDEDDVNVQLRRQQAHKAKQAKWEQQHSEALAQDASVFDYDGVYASIQEAREKPKQDEKAARQSRYIGNLLEKAKERNKEQDILYERQLERERKVEDAIYGDKEKFVTAAYKKKLAEDQKWLEEEKRKEEEEKRNDVTKREGMGDFYRNLHRNAAFGGSRLANVHATSDQIKAEEAIKKGGRAEPGSTSTKAPEEEAPPSPSPSHGEVEAAQQSSSKQPPAEASPRKEEAPPLPKVASEPGHPSMEEGKAAVESAEPQGARAAAGAAAVPTAGKRRNDQDAVSAARERYLARKRAKG